MFGNNIDKNGKIRKRKNIMTGKCIFPFKYKGNMITKCINSDTGDWCATSLTPNNYMKTWGYCYMPETQKSKKKTKLVIKTETPPKKPPLPPYIKWSNQAKKHIWKKPTRPAPKLKSAKVKIINTPNKVNIVKNFKIMINYVYAIQDPAAGFKARGYSEAIKALSEFDGEITSLDLAHKVLIDYGFKNPKKMLSKIDEIIKTKQLKEANKAITNPLVKAVNNLTKVYSVGYKNAIKLYNNHGITTVDELKIAHRKAVKENNSSRLLHGKQQLGLKFYDDLILRIPRKEMQEYEKYLLKAADIVGTKLKMKIVLSINGSYRRNLPTSGDIDVLITADNPSLARNELIEFLKENNIIIADLANGKKKYMGVTKIPGFSHNRHMDIIQSDKESYAFSVLYFTGSGGFNAKMRAIANERGYSLNEYRLIHKTNKKPVTKDEIKDKIGKTMFESEEDIFKFLDMKYVFPKDRINLTPGKL